jgi:hypothetical protein
MAEVLQSGQEIDGAGAGAVDSINALLKKSTRPSLPTADVVEFWRDAEKAGWMYSQGEHIRTWRKRWFVLKKGFLFRFSDPNVIATSKPRGIVDLSQVADVTDGNADTGRPHSIKLATATGRTFYLAESETAQVEWISALDGAVARIVKLIAGVEDEAPQRRVSSSGRMTTGGSGKAAGGVSSSSRFGGAAEVDYGMLRVVDYEAPIGGGGSGGGGGGPSGSRFGSGGGGDDSYISINYGNVAGANSLSTGAAYDAGGYSTPAVPQPQYQQYTQQYQPPPQQQPQQQYQQGGPSAFGGFTEPQQQYQQQYQEPQQQYQEPPQYTNGYGGTTTLLDAATAPEVRALFQMPHLLLWFPPPSYSSFFSSSIDKL